MSWSTRRQVSILIGVIAVITAPIIIIAIILLLEKKPTCFDRIQNGNETGVDCGGSCALVCSNEAVPPIVLWQRYFDVGDGNYNVVAYIENQNPTSGAVKVPYRFTLLEDNIDLESREGFVDIPPKTLVPIIENSLHIGKREPNRLSFDLGDFDWVKQEPLEKPFFVSKERVIREGDNPRVGATIKNTSPREVGDITAIVFVYGSYGNLIAFSSTYVDSLAPQSEKELVFTWPVPFSEEVSRVEVIPQYK